MNTITVQDSLRNDVLETLSATFPNGQRVAGGLAFESNVIDERSGKPFVVVIKVTLPNTVDTERSKAYDFEAEVESFAKRPGRRVADPEKAAARKAASEEAAKRHDEQYAGLRNWVLANKPEKMLASEIAAAIPMFKELSTGVMRVGALMKELAKEGMVTPSKDESRRNVWTFVG